MLSKDLRPCMFHLSHAFSLNLTVVSQYYEVELYTCHSRCYWGKKKYGSFTTLLFTDLYLLLEKRSVKNMLLAMYFYCACTFTCIQQHGQLESWKQETDQQHSVVISSCCIFLCKVYFSAMHSLITIISSSFHASLMYEEYNF